MEMERLTCVNPGGNYQNNLIKIKNGSSPGIIRLRAAEGGKTIKQTCLQAIKKILFADY